MCCGLCLLITAFPAVLVACSSIRYSHGDFMRGTVLVFLPGLPEIKTMQDILVNNAHYRNLGLVTIMLHVHVAYKYVLTSLSLSPPPSLPPFLFSFNVLLLHSSISSDEQSKVFLKPELGKRKVILATNIAESSITVPDIKYG